MQLTKEQIQEFKDFIIWAKEQGVAHVTIGDMQVTFFPKQPNYEFNLDGLKEQEEQDLKYYSVG